jgi:hypothetical protein
MCIDCRHGDCRQSIGLELTHLAVGAEAAAASSASQPLDLDWSFSVTRWLAVLLLFVLEARTIRFSALDSICEASSCQPGDLLQFTSNDEGSSND